MSCELLAMNYRLKPDKHLTNLFIYTDNIKLLFLGATSLFSGVAAL